LCGGGDAVAIVKHGFHLRAVFTVGLISFELVHNVSPILLLALRPFHKPKGRVGQEN
jgi:hypothetical protein